jgi:hypothetical protein
VKCPKKSSKFNQWRQEFVNETRSLTESLEELWNDMKYKNDGKLAVMPY